MEPTLFSERDMRPLDCPYREVYWHDGGERYMCSRMVYQEDCEDSYSTHYDNPSCRRKP